jgi:H+/Cl- antiporter ClcA
VIGADGDAITQRTLLGSEGFAILGMAAFFIGVVRTTLTGMVREARLTR